jgi:hypothetical protein
VTWIDFLSTVAVYGIDGELWVVHADGSDPRKLVDGTDEADWQWLPARPPPESPSPSPGRTSTPESTGSMWPQTSLQEVREAQEAADAGDPRYTWQVNSALGEASHLGQHHPHDAQLFARFLEQKLGWEAFLWNEAFAHPAGLEDGAVVYVRCSAGGTNPLYGNRSDGPGGRCGPTIDELRYETVKIRAAQVDRQGPLGIWVVTDWEMIDPFAQVAPPSDAEIAALLGDFLQARIDGEGADRFVKVADDGPTSELGVPREVPLLYQTSTGAAYERSEFEVVDGPVWPGGSRQLEVRLFADNDQTVVEQTFSVERDGTGRLRLRYRVDPATTENGSFVPVTYGFVDGEVTFRAAYPLVPSEDGFGAHDRLVITGLLPDDDAPRRVLVLLADPRPIGAGCVEGPPPADAEALARSIGSDPDLLATTPVAISIGAISGLRMDVTRAPGASSCPFSDPDLDTSGTRPLLFSDAAFGVRGNRARVWLLDRPAGSAGVLAIAMITDDDSFEPVLASATRIVDSIEFKAP